MCLQEGDKARVIAQICQRNLLKRDRDVSGPLKDLNAEGTVPSVQRQCYCDEDCGSNLC